MEKPLIIFFSIAWLCFAASAFATTNKSIDVHVNSVTSESGYYCLEIFRGSTLHRKGCSFPTRYGTDFINRFLGNMNANKNHFIKFAFSLPQPNGYWPSNPNYICKFALDKSVDLDVNVTPTSCSITASN